MHRLPEHVTRVKVKKLGSLTADFIEVCGSPGKTAQRVLRSPAGFNLAINVVGKNNLQSRPNRSIGRTGLAVTPRPTLLLLGRRRCDSLRILLRTTTCHRATEESGQSKQRKPTNKEAQKGSSFHATLPTWIWLSPPKTIWANFREHHQRIFRRPPCPPLSLV